MPNKHAHPKEGWHIHRGVVARMKRYATAHGLSQRWVVEQAITEYLDRNE
jgi:hypothetical protein